MPRSGKTLPAFTLIELLITLILAGIITAVIYQVFFYVNSGFKNYIEIKNQIADYQLLYRTLDEDVRRCKRLRIDENVIVCEGPVVIMYHFSPQRIRRIKAGDEQVFNCSVVSMDHEFLTIGNQQRRPFIESFSYEGIVEGKETTFFVHKKYFAESQVSIQLEDRSNEWN